jgi:hypothetical protein
VGRKKRSTVRNAEFLNQTAGGCPAVWRNATGDIPAVVASGARLLGLAWRHPLPVEQRVTSVRLRDMSAKSRRLRQGRGCPRRLRSEGWAGEGSLALLRSALVRPHGERANECRWRTLSRRSQPRISCDFRANLRQ